MVITQIVIKGDDSKALATGDLAAPLLRSSGSSLNRIQKSNYAAHSCREGDPFPVFPTGHVGAAQWTSEEDGLGAAWHFSWTATPQTILLVCPARPLHPEGKAREINDKGSTLKDCCRGHHLTGSPSHPLFCHICALGPREKITAQGRVNR